MPLPMLSAHSYLAAPPITPTIPHDSRTDAPAAITKQQHSQNHLEVLDIPWTAPFRDGLPTPPSDMNGVAYTNLHSYGGKPEGYAVPMYNKAPSYPRMGADFVNRMTQQQQQQPQRQPKAQVPSKQPSTLETDSQKKDKDSSTPSYLQVPTSINNGKGNLPDFAAQVRISTNIESTTRLTCC